MSLTVVTWDEDAGELVTYDNRLRVATLEATIMAEEFAAGSAEIELDDSTADFYVWPYRPFYLLESAAVGDDQLGIVGPFWTEARQWSRGNERSGSRRVVRISLRDINSLLNLRVQKGTDAERDAETDVERVAWLINTAEVIGGFGDNGYTIDETGFFFTDAPVDMSESDYTFQYSAGVLDDCLQQSGSNGYLYSAPIEGEPLRIGIWYGRTERTDYASLHKISNVQADVSPEYWAGFIGETPQYATGYVFPPSLDATLDRDPSRTITGAGLQYDGDNVYLSNGAPGDELTRRDMVFAGELVKNETQALARLAVYLDENDTEDDAVECAVQVPDWLVHAFMPGHRVQFKNSYMPGYEDDYVWMRVAKVTYRQVWGEDANGELSVLPGIYSLGLDLRAETPPGPAAPEPPGPVACLNDVPGIEAQNFYPLGQHVPPNGNAAVTPSPGVIQYHRAGVTEITEPSVVHTNSWQFPVFGSGGFGTQDYAGANLGNALRIVTISSGVLSIDAFFSHGTSGSWRLVNWNGAVETTEQSGVIGVDGSPPDVTVPLDEHCYHIMIVELWSSPGPGRFTFQGASWVPAT